MARVIPDMRLSMVPGSPIRIEAQIIVMLGASLSDVTPSLVKENSGSRLAVPMYSNVRAKCIIKPHSSPHFAMASSGTKSAMFETAWLNFCISGKSLCSGILGMRS